MLRRRPAEAGPTSAPTRHEPRAPQRRLPERPGPPAPRDGGVWRVPHATPPAPSEWPASAEPDVGDDRCPGSSAPGSLARRPLTQRPLAPGSAEPDPQAVAHRAHSLARLDEGPDEPPTFAGEPNPPAAATLPRGRQRTAYRGRRQDGRLVAVRGDGAAYGHVRSATDNRDSAPGRTVDGGTTRHTDVDKPTRARPKGSRSSPEGSRGR